MIVHFRIALAAALLIAAVNSSIASVVITSRTTTDNITFTDFGTFSDAFDSRTSVLGISGNAGNVRAYTWSHPTGDVFSLTTSGNVSVGPITQTPGPVNTVAGFSIFTREGTGQISIGNDLAVNVNTNSFSTSVGPGGIHILDRVSKNIGGVDNGFPATYVFTINGNWTATSGEFYHNMVSVNPLWNPVWSFDGTNTTLSLGVTSFNPASPINLEFQLISAVPEPSEYALMLAGLGLLGFASRRKKKNSV